MLCILGMEAKAISDQLLLLEIPLLLSSDHFRDELFNSCWGHFSAPSCSPFTVPQVSARICELKYSWVIGLHFIEN